MIRTSESFALKFSESLPLSMWRFSSAGLILYWTNSDRSDLTSLTYPIRFIFAFITPSLAALSDAIFLRTRFFPVSSRTSTFFIPSSSNTRYASLLKLSTSIFMMAWFKESLTSCFCVCIVNCSGTITR